mmetsp:Transcript_25823/g.51793  ORF Transcript_25823/g.51793 Transcript_25823/m.51793 type:complete len:335 (+) Transcript_25823:36-1040(+)
MDKPRPSAPTEGRQAVTLLLSVVAAWLFPAKAMESPNVANASARFLNFFAVFADFSARPSTAAIVARSSSIVRTLLSYSPLCSDNDCSWAVTSSSLLVSSACRPCPATSSSLSRVRSSTRRSIASNFTLASSAEQCCSAASRSRSSCTAASCRVSSSICCKSSADPARSSATMRSRSIESSLILSFMSCIVCASAAASARALSASECAWESFDSCASSSVLNASRSWSLLVCRATSFCSSPSFSSSMTASSPISALMVCTFFSHSRGSTSRRRWASSVRLSACRRRTTTSFMLSCERNGVVRVSSSDSRGRVTTKLVLYLTKQHPTTFANSSLL